ncbi:ATP-binding protein [Fibrella aquatilis]|uniref:histidine kinase n=1 Tax=Fibrella aquatilis TaxID=2817059 RepID=A0A939GA70_9BACT|nr:ATP-binding protein [Fibrella aquatilis]MBO0932628.1 histidine kinase [Fibrella aquatilis]
MDLTVFTVTIFLLFQIRKFLETKERTPRWDRWLLWSVYGLSMLIGVDSLADNLGYNLRATWLCYVALTFAAYVTYKRAQRYPPARVLLFGLVPFIMVHLVIYLVKTILPKTVYGPNHTWFESTLGFFYFWIGGLYIIAARQRKTYTKEHQARIDREEAEQRERHMLEGLVQKRTAELTQQKEALEFTLAELQATQDQLVQREKLASLGELTAGIAHEIQNPLNFVNNFSEVSTELVKELQDERAKPQAQRDAELEADLLADLVQNLEKIGHHGQRASAIVRNMLQHSRTSTGQRDLTDINALADEYLRLSYHGLRAKDKTFNASFVADLDPNVAPINVVAQDIGRVLLNLFNNAFYAVQQRQQQEREKGTLAGYAYRPAVKVSTQQTPVGVVIRVADNGTGIPDELEGKIFQPFFTTKPSGSGTGLGLSLSYDIITKGHGGTLEVESEESKGTTFTIMLPG